MSAPGTSEQGRRLPVALISAAMTVSVMSTLGTPLIPTVARAQHVSLETAQWLLTVTLLVGAVATPVLGRLGDGANRAWVLIGTLSTVLVGSIISATAYSFTQLIIGRGLQGIGYATVPLSIALARDHLKGPGQGRAIAALSISVSTGAGLGFPLTSLIAQHFSYHAAFWFGAIVCALALLTVVRIVPRQAQSTHAPVHLDVPGALLLGLGLGAVLLAVSRAETWGWTSAQVLITGGLGVLALAAWTQVQLRVAHPLIDLRLAKQRAVLGANSAGFFMSMGMFTGVSLVNRLLQTPDGSGYGFGATITITGLLLLPVSAGSLLSQPLARAVAARTDLRTVLIFGATLLMITSVGYAFEHSLIWEAGIFTAICGVGVGTSFAAMPALIVANVPPERTGSAISLNQVLRSSGGGVGSALSITVLTAYTPAGSVIPDERGFTVAFLAAAGMCLVAALGGLAFIPRRTRSRDVAPARAAEAGVVAEG